MVMLKADMESSSCTFETEGLTKNILEEAIVANQAFYKCYVAKHPTFARAYLEALIDTFQEYLIDDTDDFECKVIESIEMDQRVKKAFERFKELNGDE